MNFENSKKTVEQNPYSLTAENLIEEYQKISGSHQKQKDYIEELL